ncbi:MAG: phosphodiester glycosidase family protein [Armatimonadetes bacterium]|nr:phosphodiester glycosidase family protein [Armatimonadota bacterium]MDE2207164.1 phosphodiester glycosidase family protein [Armatimonadota bacterium]
MANRKLATPSVSLQPSVVAKYLLMPFPYLRRLATVFGFAIVCHAAMAAPLRSYRTVAAGVPLMVVAVDLNDQHVRVTGMTAAGGSGSAEGFGSMVRRTHPAFAVTGTYFDPKTRVVLGSLVVDGQLVHHGGYGTGLCLTDDNRCEFGGPYIRNGRVYWGDYDFVCCSGPRLVRSGRAGVNAGREGFHDHQLLSPATRAAVGLTSDNRLVFAATRDKISLPRMAMVMKALGCRNAIELDGGASLAFYYRGSYLITPRRPLTNLILVYDRQKQYARFRRRLTHHVGQRPG